MEMEKNKEMQEDMKQEETKQETVKEETAKNEEVKQEEHKKAAGSKTAETAKKNGKTAESAKKTAKPAGRRNQKKTTNTASDHVASELALAKKQEELDEANDKYKRLLSEFENARKRTEKETARRYDEGAKGVLEKLLPIVDNFERALQSIPEEDKDRAFEQGVSAIYKQLMTTFESIGVAPMNAEGKEFNPDLHNAVMHIEDDTQGENVVVEEMQKGYMYKDSVLRYSMVKVAN